MQCTKTLILPLIVLGLATLPSAPALGHGEVDQAQLEEFQNHLEDYRAEVKELAAELDPIVEAHAAGRNAAPDIAELIEHWEEVGIHAAIETRATITYPGIWQALISLQQAVDGGKPAQAVREAAERVEAALWQGMGAVRLAASQVGSGTSAARAEHPPASGPETVQHIMADLDQAVAAYQADDVSRAEHLIHETYMSRFEGLEGTLIEQDPELVSSLEKDFNATLPLLMQQGAPMDQVQSRLEAMKTQLESAGDILEKVEESRSEVF